MTRAFIISGVFLVLLLKNSVKHYKNLPSQIEHAQYRVSSMYQYL